MPAYNGGYFLKQLRAMGQKIPVFGPDTFAVTEVVEIAGKHANGVVCANALVDESSPAANILRAELTRLLGTSPTSMSQMLLRS